MALKNRSVSFFGANIIVILFSFLLFTGSGLIYVIGLLTSLTGISSSGTFVTVGVAFYSDPQTTMPLTSINWGTVTLNGVYSRLAYMKVNGTGACTMSMYTSNWQPDIAGQYINCTWNYNGAVLLPMQVIPIIFTLRIASSADAVTSFSFRINVVSTEA